MVSLWAALRESVPGNTELVEVEVEVEVVCDDPIVLVGEGGRLNEVRSELGELGAVFSVEQGVLNEVSIEFGLRGASEYSCPVGVSGRS